MLDSAVPQWVRLIRGPVWVSGADRRILWMNERAGRLFGRQVEDCIGRCCHGLINMTAPSGAPLCTADCEIQRRAAQGMLQSARKVQVESIPRRDIYLLAIPVRVTHGSPLVIVHCAIEESDDVEKGSPAAGVSLDDRLTPRERQVLDHLVTGVGLREIADDLGIRYSTVRNHVQHILEKLNVHSVREAIARVLAGPRR